MKKLFIVSALVLAGCATSPEKPVVPDVPIVPQKQTVNIPPGLIAPCAPLTPLDQTRTGYSQGDSVDVVQVWADEHTDCAVRFQNFVNIVSKYLNINLDPNAVGADSAPSK